MGTCAHATAFRTYLACNRALPDELVTRMNAAIDDMARDGTMRQIERKYDAVLATRGKAGAN